MIAPLGRDCARRQLDASLPGAPTNERAGEQLLDLTRGIINRRRDALRAQFGWTRFEIVVSADPASRALILEGEVVVRSLIEQLRQDVLSILPTNWTLVMKVRPLERGRWRLLTRGVTRLERFFPLRDQPVALATELLSRDGPVECLARHAGASLIRAVDGTMGWTTRPLGLTSAQPGRAATRRDLPKLERTLRSYLGVPYLLGGATRCGIDCSALVQRSFRDACGAVLPRHSLDQLRAAGASPRSFGEPGDVIYIWSKAEAPCHVGVVVKDARRRRRTVVHASTSRRCVVEESLDCFVARADRALHFELAQILEGPSCPPPH